MTQTTSIQDTQEILTFKLEKELYGISIHEAREVLMNTEQTPIPQWPDFMTGIINLRGTVVPVMDLCKKLNIQIGAAEDKKNIIVLKSDSENAGDQIGILVDSVEKVIRLDSNTIQPSRYSGIVDSHTVRGIAQHEDNTIIILDIRNEIKNSQLDIEQEIYS